MRLRSLAALTFSVLAAPALSVEIAYACTPIDYHGEFPRGGVIEQMVANAATIQVMRATDSTFAWRYPYEYPPFYSFKLEPIDTWKGWDLGPLIVHGNVAGAQELDWADDAADMSRRAEEVSWDDQSLIDWFQFFVEPSSDYRSMLCNAPYAFRVGETYLVFRDEDGALLENALQFTQRGNERWLRGPAIMPANDRNNNWLRAVREEVSSGW